MQDQNNNMYRSSDDKFFAGVCSGIAHKLGFSKWGVRFAFIIGACFMELQFLPTLSVGWFLKRVQLSIVKSFFKFKL